MLVILLSTAALAGDDRDGVAPYVGLHAGPAFSLTAFGPAVLPRLELGIELPALERNVRIFAAGHWLQPVATGRGQEPRLEAGAYDWTLRQHELAFALGPSLRLPLGAPIVPEASVGPEVYLYQSRVDGVSGGASFGETREQYTRIGVYASAGAALVIDPVELALQVAFTSSALGGVVTGEANSAAIAPMLGVRIVP